MLLIWTPPTSSAKKRKLLVTADNQEEVSECVQDREFVLLEKRYLEQVFSNLNCGECYNSVKVIFVQKRLDCKLDELCEECGNSTKSQVTEIPVTNMAVYSCM